MGREPPQGTKWCRACPREQQEKKRGDKELYVHVYKRTEKELS